MHNVAFSSHRDVRAASRPVWPAGPYPRCTRAGNSGRSVSLSGNGGLDGGIREPVGARSKTRRWIDRPGAASSIAPAAGGRAQRVPNAESPIHLTMQRQSGEYQEPRVELLAYVAISGVCEVSEEPWRRDQLPTPTLEPRATHNWNTSVERSGCSRLCDVMARLSINDRRMPAPGRIKMRKPIVAVMSVTCALRHSPSSMADVIYNLSGTFFSPTQ